jgi:hypothetical protein
MENLRLTPNKYNCLPNFTYLTVNPEFMRFILLKTRGLIPFYLTRTRRLILHNHYTNLKEKIGLMYFCPSIWANSDVARVNFCVILSR